MAASAVKIKWQIVTWFCERVTNLTTELLPPNEKILEKSTA
jgi:hypothetical protein